MNKNQSVLLAGGTGMVGTALAHYFNKNGYSVYFLSTQTKADENYLKWAPYDSFIDLKGHDFFDVIINLAGANIGSQFWTEKRKVELTKSRVESTQFLSNLIKNKKLNTNHFIQFSAIGFYGDRNDEVLDESSSKGSGFLSDLVEKWENACDLPENMTKTIVRLGVVLDYNSGALPKMLMTLPFRFATLFGNGNNYIGAIWLQDIPKKIDLILKNNIKGVVNLVGSEAFTQKSLIAFCAKEQKRSCFFVPTPAFLLKKLLGDFSEVMLSSQKVVSNRI